MEEVRGNVDRPFGRKIPVRLPPDMAAALGPMWTRTVYIPSDEVIITDILNLKVRGEVLSSRDKDVVKEIDSHDVYGGGKHPSEIFSIYAKDRERDNYVHLLTTPPPSNNIGKNGDIGAWKVLDDDDDDDDGTTGPVGDPRLGNQVVGCKKTFIYDDDSGKKFNGWLMTEYTTLQPPKVPSLNYVLCKIEKIEYYDVIEEEVWEGEEEEEEERGLELEAESAAAAAADAAATGGPARAA